jgi:D-beta-D-heptose 7-phosphate kinase/D-beta-D-heptose 1-phosphate adenosyltransferase
VRYLARARAQCDRLLVAINSDASVRRFKNPLRPINPERDRLYLVAALASFDRVTILEEDRPLNLLLRWKPGAAITRALRCARRRAGRTRGGLRSPFVDCDTERNVQANT